MSPEDNPDCVVNSKRDEGRGRGQEGEVVKEETEKRKSEKSGKEEMRSREGKTQEEGKE